MFFKKTLCKIHIEFFLLLACENFLETNIGRGTIELSTLTTNPIKVLRVSWPTGIRAHVPYILEEMK
jgi:hypothetical protein